MTTDQVEGGPVVRAAMNLWMGAGPDGRIDPAHRRRALAALKHPGNLAEAIRSFPAANSDEQAVIDMLAGTAARFLKADKDSGRDRAEAIRRRVVAALEAGQRVRWEETAKPRWAVICTPAEHDPAATELVVTIERPDASACRKSDIRTT